MNWKIIIKPINVGWLSLKPKATNSSLRPIRTANREKHRKEFICRENRCYLHINLHLNICIWLCVIRPTLFWCFEHWVKTRGETVSPDWWRYSWQCGQASSGQAHDPGLQGSLGCYILVSCSVRENNIIEFHKETIQKQSYNSQVTGITTTARTLTVVCAVDSQAFPAHSLQVW